MTSIQAHRGPDDSGLWEQRFPDGSYFALGSRRLAILDLSPDGHMPMCNPQRTLWITYNGEIYNFRELRQELQAKGHQFVSESDTEVVLHLYEEEGPDCVKRLNGMFAFAICDLRSGTPSLFRCAGPLWSETVLLRAPGRPVCLRVGDQSAAASARH